ncbi:hypothetical protein JG688_00008122 [Phytophthora aleatoria]|uniref:Uncharacterized protein n=1 Tax=Phytophthora aleatoria TaxID=2496075 RepID=A0A8J5J7B1_9STRA|nr:hypothetical protein JG688_00008122 [Phytophthora aleatoria]
MPALLAHPNIQPPPLYNAAGSSSHNSRRDAASRESGFQIEASRKVQRSSHSKR